MSITTLLPLQALALALPLLAAPPTARDTFYSALTGVWSGTLEARGPEPPYRSVRLATTATIEVAADRSSVLVHFVIDDGGDKPATSEERIAIDADGNTLEWGFASGNRPPQAFTVRAFITTGGVTTLTAEGQSEENGAPAAVRETFTIDADSIQMVREVRPKGATTFSFRSAYTLKRKR